MVLLRWLVLLALFVSPALAEKRVALVIGNNSYPSLSADEQLQKAVGDATAVGDALERLGFTVLRGTDLGRGAMLSKLSTFRRSLSPGDLGFVFFSGHGVAIDGANYLLPSDIPGTGDEDVITQSAVAETHLEGLLVKAGIKTGIVIIDACRNNPFAGEGDKSVGGTKGLVRAEPPGGVFKLYAAGTGETALDRLPGGDDPDPNSVFTRLLLPELEKPGVSLSDLAYDVKAKVTALAATVGHKQHPAQYDGGDARKVYLAGREPDKPIAMVPDPSAVATPTVATPPPNSCAEAAGHYAMAEKIGTGEAWDAFLEAYAACSPYSGYARAQVTKIRAAEPSKPPAPVPPPPQTLAALPPKSDVDRTAIAECDRLAASGFDASRPAGVPGLPFDKIDATKAVPACEAAIALDPDNARLQFQLGQALDKAGRDSEAVDWYRKAAEQGHASGQSNLGVMYDDGEGVAKDDKEAVAWYRKAAEQGNAIAQDNLGAMYAEGEGVAKDDKEAVAWYRKAAEQGYAVAQDNLGTMYEDGRGVAKDDLEALAWYRKAAEQGDAGGRYHLGVRYDEGRGVPQDGAIAAGHLFSALELGDDFTRTEMRDNAGAWNTATTFALQERLRDAGVYSGPIDGQFGPGTRKAIDAIFGRKKD